MFVLCTHLTLPTEVVQSHWNNPLHIWTGCDCITSCFVFFEFHFSIDSLQNLTIFLFTPTDAIDVSTQLCRMLSNFSGNQSRLYLSSCFFSCSPQILPWISILDPCNLYLQDDILFALLVVSSALANVWRFFWLLFLLRFCTWSLSM